MRNFLKLTIFALIVRTAIKAKPPKIPTIRAPQGAYSSHPAHSDTMPARTPLRVRRKLHFFSFPYSPFKENLNKNNTTNPPPQPPTMVLTILAPMAAASPFEDI